MPRELTIVANTGREERIELVTCTMHSQLVHAAITGACTELVCFRLQGPDALRVVGKLRANKENVSHLPTGQFISYDRLKGGLALGRVF